MARKDPELCAKIRERKEKWDRYWIVNRNYYYDWVEFIYGNQWLEDQSKLFEDYNKIPMTANMITPLANHIKGDIIQNTPNLQISPDEDVPVEEAQVRASLIKDICLNSSSKFVFQSAFGQSSGFGYSAILPDTRYVNEDSFEQEIFIDGFKDPNLCYWDVSAQHENKIDGECAGFCVRMSRQAFKNKYGKSIESQIPSSSLTQDTTLALSFFDEDSITVIIEFEKVPDKENDTLYKLSDNSKVRSKEFSDLEKVKIDGKKYILKNGIPVTVLEKRKTESYKIKKRKVAGDFVLEETDFPSKRIPLIFLDQDSYYTKDGYQRTRSFFENVRDSQMYLNYIRTQCAHILKVSRWDQFMAPRKCVSAPDTQQMWRDPSIIQGALVYDETPSGAKPEHIIPPELSQSLIQQYQQCLLDIKSGCGIYDTQLGENGNEVSGSAIQKRNRGSSKTTQTPKTKLERAIATLGEIINEMIPTVYDTERELVLPMPDSQEQKVTINKSVDEYGLNIQNDMTRGKYKIRLKPGLSFEGQKEEALESLQSVFAADRSGQTFQLLGDLYAENLPLDNNMEIRNRIRTMVPPDVIEAGKTGKPLPPKPSQPNPEMIMLQLKQQELQQKAQQAQQEAERKMAELDIKRAEIQRKAIESHQDMSLAWEKLEAEKEEAAAELQAALLRYQAEGERIQADIEINNSHNLIKILTHQTNKQSENKG